MTGKVLKTLIFWAIALFCFAEKRPERLDLELNQVPVSEAFVLLAEASGKNILVQETAKRDQERRISVSLHQQSFDEVFAQLLKESGLASRQVGETLEVGDPHLWKSEASSFLLVDAFPIKFGNTSEIFEVIKQSGWLSPTAKLALDRSLNTLLVQGTSEDMNQVRSMLKTLDIPPVQVLIEARIVEVDEQALKALGVNIGNMGMTHGSVEVSGQTVLPVTDPSGTLSTSLGKLAGGLSLEMAIQALETKGNVKVVSAPNLLVSDGQTALIEQGAEVPYATESDKGSPHVQFKKAVMGLTVTPRVINDQEVLLNLEVNKDSVSTANLVSAQNEPVINTQQIKTQVRVADKKTIVLGGIIESNQDETRRQVPGLSRLPLIGGLFISQQHSEKRKQIVIFVTPTIVKSMS